MRYVRRVEWVCSRSQGQPPGARRRAMTAASLAKAGPGFCAGRDFLARRSLGLDFLRGRESFFGDMRAFFPDGITVGRVVVFYKPEGYGKERGEIYHRGRNEGHG